MMNDEVSTLRLFIKAVEVIPVDVTEFGQQGHAYCAGECWVYGLTPSGDLVEWRHTGTPLPVPGTYTERQVRHTISTDTVQRERWTVV